jgi:hypothetical protein
MAQVSVAQGVGRISVLVAVLLATAGYARAQDDYQSWVRNAELELRALTKYQTDFMRAQGPSPVRALLDRTEVEVRSLGLPSPFVTRFAGGMSRITLPSEFLLLAKFVGDAAVVGFSSQAFNACATGYLESLRDRLSENSRRAAKGSALLRLPAPEEYAQSVGPTCAAFAKRFPISKQERDMRDQGVRSVVMFALLHELGHAALSHRPIDAAVRDPSLSPEQRMSAFMEAMRGSRKLETDADIWAADTLAAIGGGYSDVVNTVMVNYFLAITGLDCLMEAADSHPNGIRRFSRIVTRFKLANESATGKAWPSQVAEVARDLQLFSDKAASLLGCPSR